MALRVTSPAFTHKSPIPKKYTCDGEDVNPSLQIEGIPEGTKSLVLVMDDPDAPMGTWDHWVVFNIKPTETIREDSVLESSVQGKNSWGRNNYGGPCPPSGIHRYFFKVYALDTLLELKANAGKADVEKAMKGHILSQAELMGTYSRK